MGIAMDSYKDQTLFCRTSSMKQSNAITGLSYEVKFWNKLETLISAADDTKAA